jgi:drug/metabolite transporter (DMT)-like permease
LKDRKEHKNHIPVDLWLLLICIIWGGSFPLVKIALKSVSPLLFLAIRFWIGSIFLLPLFFIHHYVYSVKILKKGIVLGIFMFFGMLFQTVGLKYTSASNSGFLTAVAVVIVPLLVIIFEKKIPPKASFFGVVLATIGIYFLIQPQIHGFNKGDILTLICALFFAFEIVFIKLLIRDGEAFEIASIMIFVTAVLATFSVFLLENSYINITFNLLSGLAYIAILCTAISFTMQTYWQPKTSTTSAAIIYTTEPVFAAIFALIFIGERLGATNWIGAGLILSGIFVTELRK